MITVEQLAKKGIALLNLQQMYFKTRDKGVLMRSKHAEKEFRELCNEVIQPNLFNG